MKRPSRQVLELLTILAALVICALGLVALWCMPVRAQIGGEYYSPKGSTETHGHVRVAWNVTSATILAGTLVMSDTMAVTDQAQVAMGKGFRTWSAVPADARRILGILIADTPGYKQGYILTEGTYHGAVMSGTGIASGAILRPSLTVAGALTAMAASETTAVGLYYKFPLGRFQRYVSVTSTNGLVEIDMSGKR